jgi:hypothetical protein
VCRRVWSSNLIYVEPNIGQLWLNLKIGDISTGCISCMSLIVTVSTFAEYPRTDCNVYWEGKKYWYIRIKTSTCYQRNHTKHKLTVGTQVVTNATDRFLTMTKLCFTFGCITAVECKFGLRSLATSGVKVTPTFRLKFQLSSSGRISFAREKWTYIYISVDVQTRVTEKKKRTDFDRRKAMFNAHTHGSRKIERQP